MTLLEAWGQSGIGVAAYDYHGLEITVICTQQETLTVIMGTSDPKPFLPKDFGDFCRILGIKPEQGWRPCQSHMIAI